MNSLSHCRSQLADKPPGESAGVSPQGTIETPARGSAPSNQVSMRVKANNLTLRSVVVAFCGQIFISFAIGWAVSAESVAAKVDFGRDVLPILSQNCLQCHGPDEEQRQADLRLDTSAGARSDLGGYSAVVPNNAGQSVLIERVTSSNPDLVMPPPDSGKKRLSDAQVLALRQWLDEGAEYQQHWAFRPIANPSPPEVPESAQGSLEDGSLHAAFAASVCHTDRN